MLNRNPIDRLAQWGGAISAFFMFAMTLHMLLEIVLRNVFGTSTFVVDEFVGYGTSAMTFLALAYTLNNGALIRVDAMNRVVGPRVARVLELFAISVTFVMFSGLSVYIFQSLRKNYVRGTTSESLAQIPLWIPQFIAVTGIILFLLALLLRAVRVMRRQSFETQQAGAA